MVLAQDVQVVVGSAEKLAVFISSESGVGEADG